ncbi:ABC transporter ATP-binding protein [Sporolituus thermophilus]|uniref:Amino acid/amide ABC transporter ATP-binding protein 2, HAAT family (TC 3.A.1.4.-) n=1 Tax=Sporolituus thermophilus DSM 23256 TaxID=1123285 RepID=A0A1G7L699_9FIRM|nr:ABC transporter ATP-binding protein [Sporolituus thermophilus]SDF45062.1 amino acid/amide ABC transporter ATP-binding protein 2, HAAT family (TC 3.A.1.4.-) [Sporolituus thermophilus DSM 23256]
MLSIDGINVYYGNIHAIRDISLTVEEGEIVTIIGANGAGKTTILKTIVGLLRSRTGTIRFQDDDITSASTAGIVRRGIALVPEGRRVFPRLSVADNLILGAYSRQDKDVQRDLAKVYEMFPRLAERRHQAAGTLSGGEQQMLAMGRGLMSRPKLLLLDEPSMGLAPLLVRQIFQTILDINSMGTTILLVEQNARMALSIADRGYVLETGSVVLTGSAADLADNDEVRRAYLGE